MFVPVKEDRRLDYITPSVKVAPRIYMFALERITLYSLGVFLFSVGVIIA